MRGTSPQDTDRVWLSDEFSVEASTLCLDRPESPNSDFICVKARGHAGRHDHRHGVATTPTPRTALAAQQPEREGGCGCVGCGRRYRVDILVPDDLWKAINPKGPELLCGECIAQRLEARGEFEAFRLTTPRTETPA